MHEKCIEKKMHMNINVETKQMVAMAAIESDCRSDTKKHWKKEVDWADIFLQEKDGNVLQTGPVPQEACVAEVSQGCGRSEYLVMACITQLSLTAAAPEERSEGSALVDTKLTLGLFFWIASKFTVALLLNMPGT